MNAFTVLQAITVKSLSTPSIAINAGTNALLIKVFVCQIMCKGMNSFGSVLAKLIIMVLNVQLLIANTRAIIMESVSMLMCALAGLVIKVTFVRLTVAATSTAFVKVPLQRHLYRLVSVIWVTCGLTPRLVVWRMMRWIRLALQRHLLANTVHV